MRIWRREVDEMADHYGVPVDRMLADLKAAHEKDKGDSIRWTVPVLLAKAEEGKSRKWTARAYNGGPMRVDSPKLDAPVVVDISGITYAPSLVANLFHEETRIVGHVTDKITDGGGLDLAGEASGGGEAADEFLKGAANGFPWQASLEATRLKLAKLPRGKSAQVNGRTIDGPAYIATSAHVFGVAFLGRGADEGTHVSLAAAAASFTPEKTKMNDYQKWLAALGFEDETKLTDAQNAALKAHYEKEADELKAAAKKGDDPPKVEPPKFDIDKLKAAYAKHEAAIEAKAFEYKGKVEDSQLATLKAGAMQKAVELKTEALAKEWAPERFEVEGLTAQMGFERELFKAEAPKGPAIHAASGDMSDQVLKCAISQRLNIPEHEKDYDDKTLQAAHTTFRGRIGLQQLLLMGAAQNGYQAGPYNRVDDGNLRDVIEYAFPPRMLRAAGATVFSLSGILGSVANKELLMGFEEEDQTWREISATKTVNNFHQVTSYRLNDDMEYEELPPDGQMKHGQVAEESYTRQAKTYAKMFSLTRQDIINDDLGAFDDLRTRLGRGAARKFNKVFWTKFIANTSFFTSARANLITGATTTLLTDYVGLALGITAFDDLRSAAVAPNTTGKKIKGSRTGGIPTILLVPPELEPAALQIYAPIAAATTATVNIYANKYRPVKAHQLSDSTYTGYSTTAWYLLRDPRVLAAMVASFLNGNQTPVVESADAAFDRLGVDFRGYHDFGCDFAEFLCGIRSNGA